MCTNTKINQIDGFNKQPIITKCVICFNVNKNELNVYKNIVARTTNVPAGRIINGK